MGAWQEALDKAHKNNQTISNIKPIAVVIGGMLGGDFLMQ
jgi:LytS/YehU family sensor histidine kinase